MAASERDGNLPDPLSWKPVCPQIVFGAAGGLVISTGAVFLLKRISFRNNGFDLLLFIAIALVVRGDQRIVPQGSTLLEKYTK